MDLVVIDPPADLIAERQRLGLDVFDEVWDGEYHMVPGPSGEHQRIGGELFVALHPIVRSAGLLLRYEFNLIPPDEPGWRDFRVPDLVVCRDDVYAERGAIGPASLVVEIRSPGDESFRKLPFYERLGVGEVLIIERDTKAVRRWANGLGGLVETSSDVDGRHTLDCLPVSIWTERESLIVLADGVRTEI
jgi:Uma2 family endonuclease